MMYHCARAWIICSHFPLVTDYYEISIRKWLAALQVGDVRYSVFPSSFLTSQAGAGLWGMLMIHLIPGLVLPWPQSFNSKEFIHWIIIDINALMKWSPFIQKQIGAWPRVHIGPEDWAVVWWAIFHGLSEEMIGKLISASGYEEAGCDSANADTRGQECWWWPGALLPINCCHWPLPCPAQQPTLLT